MDTIDASIPLSFTQFFDPLKFQQAQANGINLQNARQQQQDQNALRSLFQNPQSMDPATGMPNANALRQLMAINPEMGMKLQQNMLAQQKTKQDISNAQLDRQAALVQLFAPVRDEAVSAYQDALKKGLPADQAVAAGQRVLDQELPGFLNGGGLSEDEQQRAPKKFDPAMFIARQQNDPTWQKQNLAGRKEDAAERRADAIERREKADLSERIRHDKATEAAASGDSDAMSEDTLNYAAQRYRETGQLPPMGMGKAGVQIRNKIIQRAAEQAQAANPGASAQEAAASDITTQSGVKSDQQALNQLAKTRANVANFEGTARKEADLALSLAPKGQAGQIPVLNRWIQSGRKQIAGDADVSAFDTALTSFKNEYARIMSSPGAAGGVTSDAARHEAEGLINDAQSPAQLKKNIETMKKSMQNRIDSINEEYDNTKARIANAGKPAAVKDTSAKKYGSADDVKAAYKSGDLTKDAAAKILRDQFGYQ